MPDARIPALKAVGLDIVPGYQVDPATGKEDTTWRGRYFDWYENARDWRLYAQQQFRVNSEYRENLLLLCQRDSSLFSLVFLDVEEPRSMEYFDESGISFDDAFKGLHDPDFEVAVEDLSYRTIHPLIPFAYQVEAHRLLTYIVLGPMRGFYHDLLFDKARGIGMSYAVLAWAYWGWLFIPGLRGSILTEKWDKAERSKDINSLFGKLDLFIDATPDQLLPHGYKEKGQKDANRQKGSLTNPENGAAIFTEPTTADSTRGGREAYVAVDELNFHEYLDETWATMGGTTKHRIGWSSASYRYGRQGERKFKNGREHPKSATVKTLDWFENPHQDWIWYEAERARFAAAGQLEQFEVEYLRNAGAGSGRLVYKKQLDATWFTDAGYDKHKPLKMSVDPGVADATAFSFWQTHFPEGKKVVRWLEAIQMEKVPVQFWAYVMTGIKPRGAWKDEQGIEQPPDDMWAYWEEGFFEEANVPGVMAWMATINPRNIQLYGDPAMRRRDVTHESWIKVFERETLRLREREFGKGHANAIPIYCNLPWDVLNKRNNFHDRRVGLRTALLFSEWSRHPALTGGVFELREAIANTLFQEVTERSTRAPGHIHDAGSNYVQTAEFGMVWETLELTPHDLAKAIDEEERKPRYKEGRSRGRPVRSRYQRAKRAAERESMVGLF